MQLPLLPVIASIHPCGRGLVLTDTDRNIWLQGISRSKLEPDLAVSPRPFVTPFKLKTYETISKVHHHIDLLCIYTNLERLFIFRVLEACIPIDTELDTSLSNIDYSKPFNHVTDVVFMGPTVMFHGKYGHCIFNHDLVSRDDISTNHGLVYESVVRKQTLLCYRVILDHYLEVQYDRNYVHAYSDLDHCVLSAPVCDSDSLSVVQFRDGGTLAKAAQSQIYVNAHTPTFVVMIDGVPYHDQGSTKPLKSWSKICGYAQTVNEGTPDQRLIFVKDQRVRNLRPSIEAAVPVCEIIGTDGTGILVVDNDLPDLCTAGLDATYINAKYLEWWRVIKTGILAYSKDLMILLFTTQELREHSLLTAVSNTTTEDGQTIYVYQVVIHESIIEVQLGESMAVVKVSSNRYYKIEIADDGVACWEVILDPIDSIIDPFLISHQHVLQSSSQLPGCIESDDLLIALSTCTLIFPYPYIPEIIYDPEQEDLTRDPIKKAMSLFAETYLIQHGRGSLLNILAHSSIDSDLGLRSDIISRFGQLIHMAVVLGLSLPFGPQLSILVALIDRHPTIAELEYFVAKYFPETFEQIRDLRYQPGDLKSWDYTSYREALQVILQYDPDYFSTENMISRFIAQGIMDYTAIPNLARMNLPTLDLYFTGAGLDCESLMGIAEHPLDFTL